MSWKMFGQIVLLIIIAAMICSLLKCGMMKRKYKCFKAKGAHSQSHTPHEKGRK